MPGEFFFLTFGGLGNSLAGFAGLIFVLDRRNDPEHPIARWRIMHIGTTGLSIAQCGLVTFPIFFLFDSVDLTVRITAVIGLFLFVGPKFHLFRRGPAWPSERRRRVSVTIEALTVVLWVVCMFVASVGLLMLLFVFWISDGIGTFMQQIVEFRLDPAIEETGASGDAPNP